MPIQTSYSSSNSDQQKDPDVKVLVVGAGAGGMSAVVELALAGHELSLWNRSADTLAPILSARGIGYEGVLGSGRIPLDVITTDISKAMSAAEAAVVTLPTFSHIGVAQILAAAGWGSERPILLNPGHTGGALEFAQAYSQLGQIPPIAEFNTLTYVARKYSPDVVTISGRAKGFRAASLAGGSAALDLAVMLFPGAQVVKDVLYTDLCNLNMVLHAPGAILAAAWVEARKGDFTFYVEGMTPGVVRVMRELDDERRRVGAAFGHDLLSVVDEMKIVGTVDASADSHDFVACIAGGEANKKIKAPDSLSHRYYKEDFGHGLVPFIDLARIAGVETPTADSLLHLAKVLCNEDFRAGGRTADSMGIAGLSKDQLLRKVRQGS
jgi:opine dehydrogenase